MFGYGRGLYMSENARLTEENKKLRADLAKAKDMLFEVVQHWNKKEEKCTVLYKCDKKQCKSCSIQKDCRHTTNINHAVNFTCEGNIFIEK